MFPDRIPISPLKEGSSISASSILVACDPPQLFPSHGDGLTCNLYQEYAKDTRGLFNKNKWYKILLL